MKTYTVVIKTNSTPPIRLTAIAATSMDAYDAAAARYGDDCYSISVVRNQVSA